MIANRGSKPQRGVATPTGSGRRSAGWVAGVVVLALAAGRAPAEQEPAHHDRPILVEHGAHGATPASRPAQPGWGQSRHHRPGHRMPPPGGPPEPGGPGMGRPAPREFFLSPKERREVLEFAKKHFPEVYERLRDLPDNRRRPYWRMQRFIWPMIRLMRLAKYDPELANILIEEQKVEMELARLKRDYVEFPAESVRAEIKAQMRALLERRFDLRRRRLEREIHSLQERLEQARRHLQQQNTAKSALIDTEMDTLIQHLEDQPPLPAGEHDVWEKPDRSAPPLPGPSSKPAP